jgi:hypothetical protein
MKPGRELDRLVADKVFGIRSEVSGDYILEPMYIPKYSTDIAAAWGVVEKLKEKFIVAAESYRNIHSCYIIKPDEGEGKIELFREGKSPSHAICLAALKAVGVEL